MYFKQGVCAFVDWHGSLSVRHSLMIFVEFVNQFANHCITKQGEVMVKLEPSLSMGLSIRGAYK